MRAVGQKWSKMVRCEVVYIGSVFRPSSLRLQTGDVPHVVFYLHVNANVLHRAFRSESVFGGIQRPDVSVKMDFLGYLTVFVCDPFLVSAAQSLISLFLFKQSHLSSSVKPHQT